LANRIEDHQTKILQKVKEEKKEKTKLKKK
jgi:hypothetical protein